MRLFIKRILVRRHSSVVLAMVFVVLAGNLFLGPWSGSGRVEAMRESAKPRKAQRMSVYERVGPWSLRTLDGKKVPFSECKGRVVFLNFWATWCVPCVEEMASIQRLSNLVKGDDIVFLLVTDEKEKTVRAFLDKHKLTLPIYLRGKKAPKVFKTKRLPMTYILDRQGNIAFRRTGTYEWDAAACQELIRDLMSKETPSHK